jgi:hypothetical protein
VSIKSGLVQHSCMNLTVCIKVTTFCEYFHIRYYHCQKLVPAPCSGNFSFHSATALVGPGLFKLRFSQSHSARHTTVGVTPLHGESVRRRDLYLTEHTTITRDTSMPSAGFEPATPASDRPQTLSLDRSATGFGVYVLAKSERIIGDSKPSEPHGSRVGLNSAVQVVCNAGQSFKQRCHISMEEGEERSGYLHG